MNERLTRLLSDARRGQGGAAEALLEEVYDQLRRIAQQRMGEERRGHTLQATALVHEAYVRLLGSEFKDGAEGRAQFFAAAGEAMRRILIEHARRRGREKRGGGRGKLSLDSIGDVADLAMAEGGEGDSEPVIAFDEAFGRLEQESPSAAEVVKLRFFAGLSVAETAKALGLSDRTVNNRWTFARACLARALEERSAGLEG